MRVGIMSSPNTTNNSNCRTVNPPKKPCGDNSNITFFKLLFMLFNKGPSQIIRDATVILDLKKGCLYLCTPPEAREVYKTSTLLCFQSKGEAEMREGSKSCYIRMTRDMASFHFYCCLAFQETEVLGIAYLQ